MEGGSCRFARRGSWRSRRVEYGGEGLLTVARARNGGNDPYQTTGCASPVCTLTKPSGACSQGATKTQVQGAQVSVANISRSGKPGYQRGRKVGSYIHSIFLASS